MSTTTDIDPAIGRAVEAFNDHDPDGFVAEFADDATFTDPVREGLDRAETQEYMSELTQAFPDVRVGAERVISSDNGTAIEFTFHGTHEGEFDGIPPTGETVDDTFVSIVTVSDEGITTWTDYWDRMSLIEQLGLD
ncbi:MAG: ester cyclase [Halobacteriales archaeon]|nr:ester cyclase [Halobacteriales archaeon]